MFLCGDVKNDVGMSIGSILFAFFCLFMVEYRAFDDERMFIVEKESLVSIGFL